MSTTHPSTEPERQTAQLQIPLTPSDLAAMQQAADRLRMATATWARMILVRELETLATGGRA